MPTSREEAVRIVRDFFDGTGEFASEHREGMAGSLYPKVLSQFVAGLDDASQTEIGAVLMDYALDGSQALSHASAYVLADVALRGPMAVIMPHVSRIKLWLEDGLRTGWWISDTSYDIAPVAAKNLMLLMNVVWCSDEEAAHQMTEAILQTTSSSKLRASLLKSKLLPQIRKSISF